MLDEFLSIQKALPLRTDQANKGFWSLCSQQRKVGELPARVYRKLYESLWHQCLTIWSLNLVTLLLDNRLGKGPKQSLQIFLGVGRKRPLAAAAGDVLMPTTRRHAIADIVILALHITKRGAQN